MITLTVSTNPHDYLTFQKTLTQSKLNVFDSAVSGMSDEEIMKAYSHEQTEQWKDDILQLLAWFSKAIPDYFQKLEASTSIQWQHDSYHVLLSNHITLPGVVSPQYPLPFIALQYSKNLDEYDYGFLAVHELAHILYFEYYHAHLDSLDCSIATQLFANENVELFAYLFIFENDFGWLSHQQENQYKSVRGFFDETTLNNAITLYRSANTFAEFLKQYIPGIEY